MNIFKYGNKSWALLTLIIAIIVSLTGIFTSYITGRYIDIATKGTFSDLMENTILCVGGIFLFYLLNSLFIYSKNNLIYSCNIKLKKILYEDSLDEKSDNFSTISVSLMTNDLKQFETKNLTNEILIIQSIFTVIAAFIYGFFLDYLTTFTFFVSSCVPLVISKIASNKIEKSSNEWSNNNGEYTNKLTDLLTGRDTIINYSAEKIAQNIFCRVSNNLEDSLKKMNNIVGMSTQTTILIANFCLLGLSFSFGIYQVLNNRLQVGQFISIVQVSNYLINPILIISNALNEKKTTATVESILTRSRSQEDQEKEVSFTSIDTIRINEAEINIDQHTILTNINLSINKGEKVLIVAPSGYGKSILLRSIGGFLPFSKGEYKVNGQNIINTKNNLSQSVAIIKQKPFIFNDTILFNITMGKNYSKREINQAIQNSQMKEIVENKG